MSNNEIVFDFTPAQHMLLSLNIKKRPEQIYQGTANSKAVQARHAKNKTAKRSRAANRGH